MFGTINKKIMDILGISALPVEQQKEALERLGSLVYQETMLRVLDIMSEEDKNAFEKLIAENPDPEAMFTFLTDKVPTIDAIITEEAEKLRDDAVEVMGAIGTKSA